MINVRTIVLVSVVVFLFVSRDVRAQSIQKEISFFKKIADREETLLFASLTSQENIDANSRFNVDSDRPGWRNEEFVYDAGMQAAKLNCKGSVDGRFQIALSFPDKASGHLVWLWEYYANPEWHSQKGPINTHKFCMMGYEGKAGSAGNDRRRIEQRYHYSSSSQGWLVDVRPYHIGAATTGLGKGLDRITPYQSVVQPTGQWVLHICDMNFLEDIPKFTYRICDANGKVTSVYDQVPCITAATNGGFNRFTPGWVNTSQPSIEEPVVHGWLRNAAVLWNSERIDIVAILLTYNSPN